MKSTTKSLLTVLLMAWAVNSLTRPLQAQTFNGDLTLTTQTQVDAFAYSEVTGYLRIQDDGSDPIVNLEGLSSLTSVGGSLYIDNNDALTNLEGLNSLTSVGGSLYIGYNDTLTNLKGLNSLTTVGGTGYYGLEIDNNDALINLEGLNSLTTVERYVVIWYNDVLTNFDGLSSLTTVGGLDIEYSNALTNLEGLNSLTTVEGEIWIWKTALTNLDGLRSLTTVGGGVIIYSNALTNLDGLISLTSVGGLAIDDNDALTNLDGLSSLSFSSWNLSIHDNDALDRFCGLFPLLDGDGLEGDYDVHDNLANPSVADILAGGPCDPTDKILELLGASVLNRGQANALVKQAARSLNGLAGHLNGLVNAGILSEVQAQLILVQASLQYELISRPGSRRGQRSF